MTVSFHKYGEYFPGTGELRDIGIGQGRNYAVNVPLRDGIDDFSYKAIFEPVIRNVMQYFQPEAVVLQCGGDSLSGDRLGCFNLSMRGHANCVNFVKSFNLPMMVVGGGGYTMRNVARTWAFETGVLCGEKLDTMLPYNDYYEYFAPDYELEVRPSNMDNANSPEYLDKIRKQVIENLRNVAHCPSVQMQDVPRNPLFQGLDDEADAIMDDLDEDENKDKRITRRRFEQYVEHDGELSESEDEEMLSEHGIRRQPGQARRRDRTNFRNLEPESGMSTPAAATPREDSVMDDELQDERMEDVEMTGEGEGENEGGNDNDVTIEQMGSEQDEASAATTTTTTQAQAQAQAAPKSVPSGEQPVKESLASASAAEKPAEEASAAAAVPAPTTAPTEDAEMKDVEMEDQADEQSIKPEQQSTQTQPQEQPTQSQSQQQQSQSQQQDKPSSLPDQSNPTTEPASSSSITAAPESVPIKESPPLTTSAISAPVWQSPAVIPDAAPAAAPLSETEKTADAPAAAAAAAADSTPAAAATDAVPVTAVPSEGVAKVTASENKDAESGGMPGESS